MVDNFTLRFSIKFDIKYPRRQHPLVNVRPPRHFRTGTIYINFLLTTNGTLITIRYSLMNDFHKSINLPIKIIDDCWNK